MNDSSKVKPNHTQRAAIVYIRQSSPAQVENHRESTARQYALVEKAGQLGWAQEQVVVIDEDLGLSGSGWAERSGFGRTEVGLGRVASCSAWKSPAWRAIMPTGIASSISAA